MIDRVVEECSRILSGRTVVSEWELERVVRRAAFRVLGLDALKRSDEMVTEVKKSFIDEPISIKSLHFSEEFEVNGEKFYHLHTCKPSEEELSYAYDEMLKSRRLVKNIEKLDEIVGKFFAGYEFEKGIVNEFRSGKWKYAINYSLIDDVGEDIEFHKAFAKGYDGEYAVVVLTEKDVLPFLSFFKRHSEDVKKAKFYVWVADEERNYVDPFIGYPRDLKLWKGFKNPKAASIINSLWRVNVEKID